VSGRAASQLTIASPRPHELDQLVVVMCNEGYQSSLVAATLQRMGSASATDLDGGFQTWRADGLPVRRRAVTTRRLTLQRRRLSLPTSSSTERSRSASVACSTLAIPSFRLSQALISWWLVPSRRRTSETSR